MPKAKMTLEVDLDSGKYNFSIEKPDGPKGLRAIEVVRAAFTQALDNITKEAQSKPTQRPSGGPEPIEIEQSVTSGRIVKLH